jgi:hypothetical protein
MILETALSMSAVSSTMTGHFPPSYSKQGVRFLAASIATSLPVSVDPVKQMRSKGKDVSFLATFTFPWMHL